MSASKSSTTQSKINSFFTKPTHGQQSNITSFFGSKNNNNNSSNNTNNTNNASSPSTATAPTSTPSSPSPSSLQQLASSAGITNIPIKQNSINKPAGTTPSSNNSFSKFASNSTSSSVSPSSKPSSSLKSPPSNNSNNNNNNKEDVEMKDGSSTNKKPASRIKKSKSDSDSEYNMSGNEQVSSDSESEAASEEEEEGEEEESEEEGPKRNKQRKTPAGRVSTGAKKSAAKKPAKSSNDDAMYDDADSSSAHINKSNKKYDATWIRENQRDANKNRPGHPNYDPTTLYVPPEIEKNFTPAEKQYWDIKKRYNDTVILFKIGKFYEMFDLDADIGVRDCGLSYMVNQARPHAGFPEAALKQYEDMLILAGHRVGVVDQTQTPEQLKEENKKRKSKEKAVRRELTQIYTFATQLEPTTADARYVMSIKEHTLDLMMDMDKQGEGGKNVVEYGIAIIDCSTSKIVLRQFYDDESRVEFRSVLGHYNPQEIIYIKGGLTSPTEHILNTQLCQGCRKVERQVKQFWSSDETVIQFINGKYFVPDQSSDDSPPPPPENTTYPYFPSTLIEFLTNNQHLAVSALGGCMGYLKDMKAEKAHLSFKSISLYESESKTSMMLDGQTLINLEIIQNAHGESDGTLLKFLDHCSNPMGKRLLRQWVIRPLTQVKDIQKRLDAVTYLKDNDDLRSKLSVAIKHLPDLERLVARIHEYGMKLNMNVVMYGDIDKQKLIKFLSVLQAFRDIQNKVLNTLNNYNDMPELLVELCTPGQRYHAMEEVLEYFKNGIDEQQAKSNGYVIPLPGSNPAYDSCQDKINEIEEELEGYLKIQQAYFGNNTNVKYMHKNNEPYQIEVPKYIISKRAQPSKWHQMSSTKDVLRFYTDDIQKWLLKRSELKVQLEDYLKDSNRKTFQDFAEYKFIWDSVCGVIAELDVLCSLASVSKNGLQTMVKPEFLDPEQTGGAMIELRECVHPVMAATNNHFIPNDANIGNSVNPAKFVFLSGPNMGGKSTLLRQTCLAVILAQIGCYVPAESMRLTPIDRIYTRVGANDKIMQGQSTFEVELRETDNIIRHVTAQSLVILDELGRGTSTFDGASIASAISKYLIEKKCLALFSTHYHMLIDEFRDDPSVSTYFMDFQIQDSEKTATGKTVTFLYKFTPGLSKQSLGHNVAVLAGLPDKVIKKAQQKAQAFEEKFTALLHALDQDHPSVKCPTLDIEQLMSQLKVAAQKKDLANFKKLYYQVEQAKEEEAHNSA